MNQEKIDEMYMRRCLQLARNGRQNAKPNPMVGAVIVCEGRIIGEGYHVRCGEGHAEVNAFASIKPQDEPLLHDSTLYVSLEPCSHYGRTPPCADLIVKKNVQRVVVGCIDPFAKVHGRGIRKLRNAGIQVTVGVLEAECMELNKRFIISNTEARPYVILKWAQTADGFLDDHYQPAKISTPFTQMLVHKLRAENDAILVGRVTDEREHPRLDTRLWNGPAPLRLTLDSTHPFAPEADFSRPVIPQLMSWLHERNIESLVVEGGAATLQSFIDCGTWDEVRVETAPIIVGEGTTAPRIPMGARLVNEQMYDRNVVCTYEKEFFHAAI